MRYCNQCHRITTGEPLFCNFCGRTYDVKLCPHRHVNPRSADICSQCGSRDLSTPQPRPPLWRAPLFALLSIVPGLALLLITVLFLVNLTNALLNSPQALLQLLVAGTFIALLWRLYLLLPGFVRNAVSRLLGRSRGDRHGR